MPRQAVFFLIDTQGAGCVGCYAGLPALGTSNIDRLAAEGVRFNAAYTCSPVCGPARSAIFTGLYPHGNGVLGNDQSPHLDIPTLGQRLDKAGIRAGYIGKWHLDGTDYFGDGRCPPGWDPACWFDGRNYLDSLPDQAARDLSRRVLSPAEVARHGITAGFTHAHRTADRAIEFIRRRQNEDFFLVVSIDEPHHPFICPESFASAFEDFLFPVTAAAEDTLERKPRVQREWAENHASLIAERTRIRDGRRFCHDPRYFGCNSFSDHEVGRVLAAIDTHAPSAMVVYTADHGESLLDHRITGKGPAMYEQITRVPLIVRRPGHAPAGAVAPGLASHIDLVPTFLDFFGIESPPLLHGVSLLPAAVSPERRVRDLLFIEFNRYEIDHDSFGAFAPIRCAFDGRHKLAVNLLDIDEFYDLADDPAELDNRIDDSACAATRDRLHDALLDWMNRTRDPLRGPHWGRRPWREVPASTWGGPMRPRPFDTAFSPKTLLYSTGRVVEKPVYSIKELG